MSFSPDGTLFVFGSWGYYVKVFRTSDWKPITQLQPNGEVNSVAFSPDGKYLVVGSNNGAWYESSYQCTVSVWNTQNWKMVRKETFSKGSCIIKNLVFSDDGKKISYTMWQNNAQVRNFDDLKLIAEYEESKNYRSDAITFNADGSALIIATKYIALWDYLNNSVKDTFEPTDTVSSLHLISEPSGLMVLNAPYGTKHANISFWDIANVELVSEYSPLDAIGQKDLDIWSSAFSDDKRLLAVSLLSEPVGGEISGSVKTRMIVFLGTK